MANAKIAQLLANGAGFFNLSKETCPLLLGTHGRAAARRRPDRSNQRAYNQPAFGYVLREMLQIVIGGIDAGVRQGQEQVDAVKADSVYFGLSGQVEHGFQGNERFGVRALADEARPHGVVDGRVLMLVGFAHRLDLPVLIQCSSGIPKE